MRHSVSMMGVVVPTDTPAKRRAHLVMVAIEAALFFGLMGGALLLMVFA